MSPPGKRTARAADPGPISAAATKQPVVDRQQPAATVEPTPLVAVAIRYARAGRAIYDRDVVQRCPLRHLRH